MTGESAAILVSGTWLPAAGGKAFAGLFAAAMGAGAGAGAGADACVIAGVAVVAGFGVIAGVAVVTAGVPAPVASADNDVFTFR